MIAAPGSDSDAFAGIVVEALRPVRLCAFEPARTRRRRTPRAQFAAEPKRLERMRLALRWLDASASLYAPH